MQVKHLLLAAIYACFIERTEKITLGGKTLAESTAWNTRKKLLVFLPFIKLSQIGGMGISQNLQSLADLQISFTNCGNLCLVEYSIL